MLDPRTLRGRLTLAYAFALIIGLCAYAVGALIFLHHMEQTTLDRQLSTAANAVLAIVEERNGKIVLEDADDKQFYAILGLRLNGAILDASGATVVSNVAHIPQALYNTLDAHSIVTLGTEDDRIRALSIPIAPKSQSIGTVIVWHSIEWFANLEKWVFLASVFTIGIIVVPAIAAGGLIARRELEPLEYIANVASEIEAHDLAQRLNIRKKLPDELSRLSSTFNRMLDRLQAAFERERRFTADASHELRAPLAVIAAETDLALRREREPAEYRATLRTIAEVAGELENLIGDLLEAVRVETDAREALDSVAIDDIVTSALERLQRLITDREIEVRHTTDPAALVVADPTATRRALIAILHNALKFTPPRSLIHIDVVRQEHEVLVHIADSGPGFTPTGLAHALERFWRADPARSPGSGSGLGLAIANTLIQHAGGRIELANDAQSGGGRVTLRLPH